MTISAFLPVFNEEKRISEALKSLLWCDEIIVLDKKSTDNTIKIAQSFGSKVKVYSMNNTEAYDVSEVDLLLKYSTSEWLILFTASDVIHPILANKIKNLITDIHFDYDVLYVPFKRYILGLNSKRSPWYSELNPIVYRKAAVTIDESTVHGVFKHSDKIFKLKFDDVACMYHLTHETVDIMMERYLRYWRGESLSDLDLKDSFKNVIKSIIRLTFFKRTFMLGYDGIMLMFVFLSYQMMSFVYKWEKKRGLASQTYLEIKNSINSEWEKSTYR